MTTCPQCQAQLPQPKLPTHAPYTDRRSEYGPAQRLPQSMHHPPRLPPKTAQVRFRCHHCQTWIRWQPNGETRQTKAPPLCPSCQSDEGVECVRRANKRTGQEFWGCPNYPRCKARVPQVERIVAAPDYGLVDVLAWRVSIETQRIEQALAAGNLSQTEANEALNDLEARISHELNTPGGTIVLNPQRERMLVEIEERKQFYGKKQRRKR